MNWKDIQSLLLAGDNNRIWGKCPVCGSRVIQGVAEIHIREEHPEIAENIDIAIAKGVGNGGERCRIPKDEAKNGEEDIE